MKSNFEERKENRISRFHELAHKARTESKQLFHRSHELASVIPMGQPILVGHHSEKSHRSHLARIHKTMDKAVQTDRKADYFESRIESIESNTAISSDDPNALEKLKAKLETLEKNQAFMKASNKILLSKKLSREQKISRLVELSPMYTEDKVDALLVPDFCGRCGFYSYKLTNNNANIKRIKDRIAQLTKIESMTTQEETLFGVVIVTNVEDNRLQLFFPGKPEEKVREELKRNGFRWSPMVKAWQRQISTGAMWAAKDVITRHYAQ